MPYVWETPFYHVWSCFVPFRTLRKCVACYKRVSRKTIGKYKKYWTMFSHWQCWWFPTFYQNRGKLVTSGNRHFKARATQQNWILNIVHKLDGFVLDLNIIVLLFLYVSRYCFFKLCLFTLRPDIHDLFIKKLLSILSLNFGLWSCNWNNVLCRICPLDGTM